MVHDYHMYWVLGPHGENVALDDDKAVVWAEYMAELRARGLHLVARYEYQGVAVSTVFLGINHNWEAGPPILFETMVFGGALDDTIWRYSTRKEALAGHDAVVALVEQAKRSLASSEEKR